MFLNVSVNPEIGDSHPLGALPVGTIVHNVEERPGIGGGLVRAAGCGAMVLQLLKDGVVIRIPSGREIKLARECRATVGKVGEPATHQSPIGHPKRNRWFGVRPHTGKYTKKDGYNGRKIKGPKPIVTYEKRTAKVYEMFDDRVE